MACCFLMAGHEVEFSMAFRSRYTYRLLMHFYHPLFYIFNCSATNSPRSVSCYQQPCHAQPNKTLFNT